VPFTWTFGLWPFWVLACGYLLAAFLVWDRRAYAEESSKDIARDATERQPLQLRGWINVPLLAGVIGCIFLPSPWREVGMVALTVASVVLGPRPARAANGFTYGPIVEVGILFAGIFVSMVPALALLEAHGDDLLLSEPWQFFLVTGGLSSTLDNAPTYLTFLAAAMGLTLEGGDHAMIALTSGSLPELFLVAISCGAVFMGANTYIGNGPNFMVKAIAEENDYPMPSFFAFALRAGVTLAPVYLAMVAYLAWAWG
jgi:Na+/H+ antiporter NhaD/arsenite permease-like protein